MSGDYVYVVDQHVLQIFLSSKGRDRENLLRIFTYLSREPMQRGDYVQRSAAGRDLQVKRFGNWLVTYWTDYPVLELRIVDLKRLAP